MKNIRFNKEIILIMSLLFGLYACNNNASSSHQTDEIEEHHEHDELAYTAEQMKAVDIRIDTISMKNMHAVVRSSGQLSVPPQNRADVNVLMGGIVQKILVQEGENVRKGQTLALLENQEFIKLQEEYLTAKKSFVYTSEERQRQQELADANAGTGKNLQLANANYQAEKARLLSLKKQLELLGISPEAVEQGSIATQVAIRATISGTVGHIVVNTGTYATSGNPLMEIIDNSKVHADLIVFEKDLFKVKNGQSVRFVLTNQENKELTGTIYGINKSFEDETKGIVVHVSIQNAADWHLIPGMFVTGLIDVGSQSVPAVPVEALVRTENKDYIYVVATDEGETGKTKFKRIEVVAGVIELGYVQITAVDEIPANTQIVSKGAFYLLSAERSSEEEHVH